MRRGIRALSRLSMVVGVILTVVGLAIRVGGLGMLTGTSPSPSAAPSASPHALVASSTDAPPTTPPATEVPVEPSAPPTEPPATPAPSAVNLMTLVFEDTFEFEGAWPTGELGDLDAAYADGLFVVTGPGSDLPTFIAPVAGPLTPASTVVVEAALTLEPYAEAGVYVGTGEFERVGATLSADGRVGILRDTTESLDVIGTGSVAVTGPTRLALTLDGSTASVAVNGRQVVTVALTATAVDFGLVIWPTDVSVARIAEFRVQASPN